MKLICKCISGSRMYGLDIPSSDFDWRGVFLNTKISQVIGLDRYEHQDIKSETEDVFYWELRHFMNLLRKTNTMVLELMFNDKWIEIDPIFEEIQDHKYELIDTEKQFKSLLGYVFNEKRLSNGERTGLLGGKRKEALQKFGFSYKNFVQLFRLLFCGTTFFKTGKFPVNIMEYDPDYGKFLLAIKTTPENFNKEDLNKLVEEREEEMKKAFDNRTINYTFNEDLANELILDSYLPILKNYRSIRFDV